MPPSSWYLADEFARAEAAAVFGPSWQPVCRAEEVATPGQYVATFVGSGEPVVAVRGDDGVLRAFSNVCRHHAALVAQGCGRAREFVCPYHAWTYSLRGGLTKFTRMRGTKDFDAASIHLPYLDVEQWGPIIFVRSPGSKDTCDIPNVAQMLAPAATAFDTMDASAGQQPWSDGGWKRLHFLRRRVYEIECNWKVYCDNYLDGGYHIPHLHRGLNSELDMSTYRTDLFPHLSIQKCRSKSQRIGSDAAYVFVFPNFAINRYGDWLDTNLVLPVAPDRCVVLFDWYHVDNSGISLAQLDQSRAIQDEDVLISELVQRGINSTSYEAGRYSPTVEIAEYHFHRQLRDRFNRFL